MSGFAKQNIKDIIRTSYYRRPPKSAESIPRNIKSINSSYTENVAITQSTVNKSACLCLLKNLTDISETLDFILLKSSFFDEELSQLVQNCENYLKQARQTVLELSSEDDFFRYSDSKLTQNFSLPKHSETEYSAFLEYVISYLQAQSELIIKKSKFPKSRMPEVEKSLLEEMSMKKPKNFHPAKPTNERMLNKSKKDAKEALEKIKKKLIQTSQIPETTLSLLDDSHEKSDFDQNDKSSFEVKTLFDENKILAKENKKLKKSYEGSVTDHKKLNTKYNYLIEKLNRQEEVLKKQSRILKQFSQDPEWLKDQFTKLVEEMKFYMALIKSNLAETSSSKLSFTTLIQEKALLESSKDKMKKELEGSKQVIEKLEFKIREAHEEIIRLRDSKEISDDSLNLAFNLNDLLEINKLKEQVKQLTFKLSESQTNHKIEVETYKSLSNKLKSEKFFNEENIKSLNIKILELTKENEKLLQDISKISDELSDNKFKPIPMLSGDTFNVADPSESSGKPNIDLTSIEKQDVDQIIETLLQHNIFPDYHLNKLDLLKKSADFLVNLRENLTENFEKIIENLIENHRKKQELSAFRKNTESFLTSKQVEVYKSKLKDKKSQLELCQKQISFLKKSLKESKEALQSNPVDLDCLKEMFLNIIREVGQLNTKTENLIEVLLKSLGLSEEEILKISAERKTRRGVFKGFFK